MDYKEMSQNASKFQVNSEWKEYLLSLNIEER